MTFKTASGKEYECPYFSTFNVNGTDIMYISVSDKTMAEAVCIFSDASEMSHIEYGNSVADGYTQLEFLKKESYGIRAEMTKPRGD